VSAAVSDAHAHECTGEAAGAAYQEAFSADAAVPRVSIHRLEPARGANAGRVSRCTLQMPTSIATPAATHFNRPVGPTHAPKDGRPSLSPCRIRDSLQGHMVAVQIEHESPLSWEILCM